jgi:outer membrane protein OmpA-like peptidoglycan-associated protein
VIVFAAYRPWSLLLCSVCCLLVAACAGDKGLHDKQRDAAGAASGIRIDERPRAVFGGMDNVVAGAVITRYMDRQAEELKAFADILRVGDGIIVTLPEKVLFKFDSAGLEPQSRRLLRKIAVILNRYVKTHLTIVGHTDDRGFANFDIRLSEHRAKAVADALVKLEVSPKRIRIMGMGFERPVSANDSVGGRALNRRVEIHIAPDEQLREEDQSPSS